MDKTEKPVGRGFAVQVFRCDTEEGRARMFVAPDGWDPYPFATHPCEVVEQISVGTQAKLLKVPAVMVLWQRAVVPEHPKRDPLVDDETGAAVHRH